MDKKMIAKELLMAAKELMAKDDHMDNVWGRVQSVKGIKEDLKSAIKTKKDVMDSQSSKSMPNAKFIRETKKLLKKASVVTAGWSGSAYQDMEKAHKVLALAAQNVKSVVEMMNEASEDLIGDFEMYEDKKSATAAKDLMRSAQKKGKDAVKLIGELMADTSSAKRLIDRLADHIEA